jgi:hypothetical protein
MRTIVGDVLPAKVGLIRDTIDPLYVGAIGAAEWAKRQVLEPSFLEDIVTINIADVPEHAEL